MIYGGLGYGVHHLRWGGGIIYFYEVVCVALGGYLNEKKLQTLQYKNTLTLCAYLNHKNLQTLSQNNNDFF